MLDGLLSGLANVIRKVASVIPSVSIPWEQLTEAVAEWTAGFQVWMQTFPFLHTTVVVLGLMVAVLVAKVLWYWVNWFINKLPFVG